MLIHFTAFLVMLGLNNSAVAMDVDPDPYSCARTTPRVSLRKESIERFIKQCDIISVQYERIELTLGNLNLWRRLLPQVNAVFDEGDELSCESDSSSVLYVEPDLSQEIPSGLWDSILQLSWLQKLDLCRNNLRIIPKSINQLSNLNVLDLSENKLGAIPNEVGDLYNLTELNISWNSIPRLPLSLFNLLNLKSLYVSDNKLTNISFIVSLVSLENLDLSDNQINVLPVNFGNLGNLKVLYLYGNPFSKVPSNFNNLGEIQEMTLPILASYSTTRWNWGMVELRARFGDAVSFL